MKLTYREALKMGLRDALTKDQRVFLIGEDIGSYGGTYGVTKNFLQEFGAERVMDAPLSENGFTGLSIGAALGGLRPVVEIMTVNFALLAFDQIINSMAIYRHMSGGELSVPVIIRMTTGGGRQLAAQHSNSFEGWLSHIPGLKILTPATVRDARWMLLQALRENNPVLIFEHALLFNEIEEVLENESSEDPFKAIIRQVGEDLTIVTYGGMLPKVMEASRSFGGSKQSLEIIDLRSLRPLDEGTLLTSVRKTKRCLIVEEGWRSVSLSSEISAILMEKCFKDLKIPVRRVCRKEVPVPYGRDLENEVIPQTKDIIQNIKEMLYEI